MFQSQKCVMDITDDYDSFINCTNHQNEDIDIIIKFILLSFPSGVLLLSLIVLILYTTLKPLVTKKNFGVFIPSASKSLYQYQTQRMW